MSTSQDQMDIFAQFLRAEQQKTKGPPPAIYQTAEFNVLFSAGFFLSSIFFIRQFGNLLA